MHGAEDGRATSELDYTAKLVEHSLFGTHAETLDTTN